MSKGADEWARQGVTDAFGLAPPDMYDPIVEAYKQDVDRTLLRENLRLSVEERFLKFESYMQLFQELKAAGQRHLAQQTAGVECHGR